MPLQIQKKTKTTEHQTQHRKVKTQQQDPNQTLGVIFGAFDS